MAKHLMTCPRCNGTGRAEIENVLEDTLAVVPRTGSGMTATQIMAKLADPDITGLPTVNNRLVALEMLGYVARSATRMNRNFLWKRIK